MINTTTAVSSFNTLSSGGSSNTSSTNTSEFATLLQEKQASNTTNSDQNKAPTLSRFMAATGADFSTAAQLVSGVVGANKDERDWSAIMASADPLSAAKQATNALFFGDNAANQSEALKTAGYRPVNPEQIVAQSKNVAVLNNGDGAYHYTLLRQDGFSMGSVGLGDAQGLLSLMDNYGIDKSQLTGLADALDKKGINYEPSKLYEGSNHGIDLRNLAQGGMGTNYDWTQDDNVALKDAALLDTGMSNFAADNIRAAQSLAANLGIKLTSLSDNISLPKISTTQNNANTTKMVNASSTDPVSNTSLGTDATRSTTDNVMNNKSTPNDLLTQLTERLASLNKMTTQSSVGMTQFLSNDNQLQSLFLKLDQLKKNATL